jgi:anthranilate phosphoribosyltransferase
MGVREALFKVVDRIDLSEEEASAAMQDIVAGTATPAQIGAFAVALRMKGESVAELAGLARVMQDAALRVETDGPTLDVVGTGGDGAGTFNISTASALVAAAAGARIAKHHNRAISGQVGGADFLGAIGIVPDLPPAEAAACIRETGIGFLFAPAYHPAMANAAAPRREIGVRTVFNTLGPLTNPARAQHHLLGVAVAALAPKMAEALNLLGVTHSLVVHGSDGIDEVTLTGPTEMHEVRSGGVKRWDLNPTDYGFDLVPPEALKGGDAAHNAQIAHEIFAGEPSAYRVAVELNAGVALYAADRAASVAEGIALARQAIESGAAAKKLEQVIATSQRLKPAAA